MPILTINNTQEYLQAMTDMVKQACKTPIGRYYGMDDFILQNGQAFQHAPLPEGIKRGKMKMCYQNAAILALDNPKLIYCEGYAHSIIHTAHAFCVTEDGFVVDPTWKDGKDYYGVLFKTEFLRETILKRKYYGIIDDWQNHWPIFTTPKEQWHRPLLAARLEAA